MMAYQVERTKTLFASARPLLGSVPPRLRFELALTWHGGMEILHKVEQRRYDVLGHRPVITPGDKLSFMWAAFRTIL
jgi:phytoene/squalene synthetase